MAARSPNRPESTDPHYREEQSPFPAVTLVTEVRDDGVYVRFRPLHRSFQRFEFENVEGVRVADYSPGAYGGYHWGIRLSPGGNRVYRVGGNRGVEFDLGDGRRVFVGSRDPGAFADAVATAREGDADE